MSDHPDARERTQFIEKHRIDLSDKGFDECAGSDTNRERTPPILGLKGFRRGTGA